MVAPDARPPRHFYRGPTAAAHVFALAAFALAQPLFDLLSRQAEFFVAHDAQPLDLVMIALLPSVALPASLLVVARSAAWLVQPAGRWAHLALVAGLSGLIALQVAKRLAPEAPGGLLFAAAAALGLISATGYRRLDAVRTFLTFVSPAAVLPPVLFLFLSPVRDMLLPPVAERAAEQCGAADIPIVMLVLDELPLSSLLDESNQIDPLHYPNLATLAGDAYWYPDATTVAYSTVESVPIILTGRVPERRHLPLSEHYPDNLFTWLAGAGYRLNVFEARTRLCTRELCPREAARRSAVERLDAMTTDLVMVYLHLLLPAELAARLPAIDTAWRDFAGPSIGTRLKKLFGTPETAASARHRGPPELFAAFLEPIIRSDRPELHFIHLILPHTPWRYLPSGKEYSPVGAPTRPHGLVKGWWGGDAWEVIQAYQRHLLQLGYVDLLVGRLVAKLKQQGLYDSALIVLLADHGATFQPLASMRVPTSGYFADVLNIPLLIKLPGQTSQVVSDRNVETIDVLPTIADVLDLPLPWLPDGRSAFDPGAPERHLKLTLERTREGGFERRHWDPAALRANRERSVGRKYELFGFSAKPDGLFRIGRRADLIGQRVAKIQAAGAASAARPTIDVRLDQAWFFEEIDLDDRFIPAYVIGQARFGQPRHAPVELAVAINGTVEAVTRTFDHDGDRARFTAMVREEALDVGRNRVEVFEISPRRGGVLVPTRRLDGGRFALIEGASGEEAIRAPDGRRIQLVEGHLKGRARLYGMRRGVQFRGWAGLGPGRSAAETLVVFVGGRQVFVTDVGLALGKRGAKAMRPWRRAAGFRFRLPHVLAESGEMRLIAILGDAASEIALERPESPSEGERHLPPRAD